jgi:thiamine phosphate synthase YjbQ (UPF0047 family)
VDFTFNETEMSLEQTYLRDMEKHVMTYVANSSGTIPVVYGDMSLAKCILM